MSQEHNNIRNSFLDGLEVAGSAPQEIDATDALLNRLQRGNIPSALSKLLMSTAARRQSPACASFVSDVVYRGGLEWRTLDPAKASYQVMRADRSLLTGLNYESRLADFDDSRVQDLIETALQLDIPLLASAVWASDSFAALKLLVRNLGAALRYSSDLQGQVQGLVVPGPILIRLLAEIEANGYLRNVELRSYDDLPDLFGLRRKVMQLDQERHESQQPVYGRYDPRRLLGLLRR